VRVGPYLTPALSAVSPLLVLRTTLSLEGEGKRSAGEGGGCHRERREAI